MLATLQRLRTDVWKWPLPRAVLLAHATKGLQVPPEGWHARNFALHGASLINSITRIAFLTQRRAIPFIARTAHALFKRQMDQVIAKVLSRTQQRIRSAKAQTVEISLPQHEGLWVDALNEVFAEAGIEIVAELMPPIQSIMAQGYSKVGELLGHPGNPDQSAKLRTLSQTIAQKITGINDTTRDKFRTEIQQAIEEGRTVVETAERLRATMTEVHSSRITTIARTETNNAFTEGTAAAYRESETLTHVSIIGCEAREPNSPHYRGESTCNYEDLPVVELDAFLAVGFHPNHTGSLVPSKFRNEDGTV